MARAIRKRMLTDRYLSTLRPDGRRMLVWDAGERGLAVQVHPTGRVVFKFIYSRAGRSRWVSIGHYPAMSLSAARVRARKLRVIVDDGGDPADDKQAGKRAGTLDEMLDAHVEHIKTRQKSWAQRERFFRLYVRPSLGQRRLVDIGRGDVAGLFDRLTNDRGPVAANLAMANLSAAYSWALKQRLPGIDINPCLSLERNPTKPRDRFLTVAELRTLLQGTRNHGRAGDALRTILLTGARPGEVAEMTWDEIADNWWAVPGAKHKSGKPHHVYLSDAAMVALGARVAGRVFRFKRSKVRAVAAALRDQVGGAYFWPHDLRATCATHLSALGVPKDAVAAVLGHAEVGTTSIYIRHRYDAAKRVAMRGWAAWLADIEAGKQVQTTGLWNAWLAAYGDTENVIELATARTA